MHIFALETIPLEAYGEKDLSSVRNTDSFSFRDIPKPQETSKMTIHTQQSRKLVEVDASVELISIDKQHAFDLEVSFIPNPIKPWQPAQKGTVDEFAGALVKAFPELANVTQEDVEEALSSSRNKDLE